MWKFVAFVLVIGFSVPAVIGEDAVIPDVIIPMNETSNTEIIAETNTTTISPTTTSIASPTTTSTASPTTTSTASPTTTSTASPTTTSTASTTEAEATTSNVTTVSPPPPTALPPPDVGKYNISEKDGKTCLQIEMALRVSIHDTSYNFPANASTEGSDCNVTHTEVLKLTSPDQQQILNLVFVQEDQKNYVQNITYTYYSASEMKSVETSGHFFSASKGNSYLCHSDVTIKMENVTLTFSSVHVQAFGADSFGRAEECDADDKVGDIVPIAVGCALGALVIIVLIAYLVGRRRSHQKGYQSV